MGPSDRVSSILKIINANRNNLDHVVEELSSYSGAPKSKEDIEQYGKKLIEDLTNRLEEDRTEYFPGVSDNDIREKIFPPLREYIENTPEKLIVSEHGTPLDSGIFFPDELLDKGEINIHPLLVHLYGLEGATSAVVYYGPTSIKFSPVIHHAYFTHSGEIYIGFHENDIGSLFMDSILELMDKYFTKRDFRVELDPSRKTAIIQVEKIKPSIKPSEKEPPSLKILFPTEENTNVEVKSTEPIVAVPKFKELLKNLEIQGRKDLPATLGLGRPFSDVGDVLYEIETNLTSLLFGVVNIEKKDSLDEDDKKVYTDMVKLQNYIKDEHKQDRLTENDVEMIRQFSYDLTYYAKRKMRDQEKV